MNILLISSYPNEIDKSRSIFVYRLMQSLADLDCTIVVISPQNWREKQYELKSLPGEKKYGFENTTVYRPKYFDFPNRARIGDFSLGQYNAHTYKNAVKKIIRKIDFKPDVVYAHFLYRAGPAAILAAKYFNVPAVVALGESSLEKHENIFTKNKMRELIHQFSGVISVSEKNKNYCIEELGVNKEKIKVFPNAVNQEIFYPRNKEKMREKYNLPKDKFIVAFTGHFIERKGPLRVLDALEKIEGNVGGVFIGSGKQEPFGDKVLFKGRLKHEEVAEMLSAADVFVLPTQNEGSCNAIVEAMACGLPIVSSDIEAIKEQVNKDNAILCSPNSVPQLKIAIETLYYSKESREQMRINALSVAEQYSAISRAKNIKTYLKKQICENKDEDKK